jgi:CRISPR system Cascade subunit CasA
MNLLTDSWIPIQQAGVQEKITLEQLLCGEKEGDLCLPRDDMEFACLQLLASLTQVLFIPTDKKDLIEKITKPLSHQQYAIGCENKLEWFDLDHPETPFMQFKGVSAKEVTSFVKLMAGLDDGTNKVFVNPFGVANSLCGGCAAIALFNTANNSPNLGGGFKAGIRGNVPITVMLKGSTLRETIWFNTLTEDSLDGFIFWHRETSSQTPNYVDKVASKEKININSVGLTRGLFWQGTHFELLKNNAVGVCSCCGFEGDLYCGFNKEKFDYTIEGLWPHPYSPRMFSVKKGEKKEYIPSFSKHQPAWTHLAKFMATNIGEKEGYEEVPVIKQYKNYRFGVVTLAVGGYCNNKAMIEERRHEIYSLADGWESNQILINQLIQTALDYKDALYNSLSLFCHGYKNKKNPEKSVAGTGVDLVPKFIGLFYKNSEALVHAVLASIKFDNPQKDISEFVSSLRILVVDLFNQATDPYQQEPKMLKALAVSRSQLINVHLKNLETLQGVERE